MHIFFSGIGGSAIGPLAIIAKQAGYTVSGSDQQASSYTDSLKKHGIDFYIGQDTKSIQKLHKTNPIDWFVYSSAIKTGHPELDFAKASGIKISKRDELLNKIIQDKNLKLIAIAGTHGKTTTTAMMVWLFKKLNVPVSYSVGAKINFGPMGEFDPKSKYFVYECDEFDRNFLAFKPWLSLITGVAWDHHEIFKTRQDYNQAFKDFLDQSGQAILWAEDFNRLDLELGDNLTVLDQDSEDLDTIKLAGLYNRRDAWLTLNALKRIGDYPTSTAVSALNDFPGLKQRMEKLLPNLYTNYAHTPEKIKAGMNAALEISGGKELVVIYEPLTNRRQHYILNDYKNCFKGAKKIYWVPTYLAREDPKLKLLTPQDLIPNLAHPSIAEPAKIDQNLLNKIKNHLKNGDIVVTMGASGSGSLDEWLRDNLKSLQDEHRS